MMQVIFTTLTPSVHKMVKHALKFFRHLLQDFKSVFDYFADTRC